MTDIFSAFSEYPIIVSAKCLCIHDEIRYPSVCDYRSISINYRHVGDTTCHGPPALVLYRYTYFFIYIGVLFVIEKLHQCTDSRVALNGIAANDIWNIVAQLHDKDLFWLTSGGRQRASSEPQIFHRQHGPKEHLSFDLFIHFYITALCTIHGSIENCLQDGH